VVERPDGRTNATKPLPKVDVPSVSAAQREHTSVPVSHAQIEIAAFDLWKQRGGSPEQNWLEAEARLRRQADLSV